MTKKFTWKKFFQLNGLNSKILFAFFYVFNLCREFYGRGFWHFIGSAKAYPCIAAISERNRSLVNEMSRWNIDLPREFHLQVSTLIYEDDFRGIRRQIQFMKLGCSDIYLLMFLSPQKFTDILEQIKRGKLESLKLKWVVQSPISLKYLTSKTSTGNEIRIIEKQKRGFYSLSAVRVYYTNVGDGLAHKKELLAFWKDDPDFNQPEKPTIVAKSRNPINLEGRILNVTVVDDWPFFGISKVDGKLVSSGIDANIVDSMAKSFNFTLQIVSPEDGNWGGPTENGSITGMIGMVAREEADIAIDEITITGERQAVVDFTYPYYFEPTIILTLAPHQASKAWAVFTPFSKEMWLVLALSVLFYGFLLWFVRHFLIQSQEVKEMDGPISFIFHSLSSIIGQDALIRLHSWTFRYMFISFSIVGLLFRVLYSGILTAALVAPSYEKPIDSLEELVEATNLHFVIRKGTNLEKLLQTATGGIYKQLYDKLLTSPISYTSTSEEYLKLIMQGGYATIAAELGVEISTTEINRELFHLSRESFYPQFYGMALNRASELSEEFNKHLAKLFEAGIIEKWKNDQVNQASLKSTTRTQPNTSSKVDKGPKTLKLLHLQGAFYLYLIGVVLSMVGGVLELCFKRLNQKFIP